MGERQILLEKEMLDSGVKRYFAGIDRAKHKVNQEGRRVQISDESNTSYGISIMKVFVDSIADCIRYDTKEALGKPGRKPIAWEYLATINPEKAAYIAAKAIINSISRTVKLTALAIKIASKLEDNCRFEALESADRRYFRSMKNYLKDKKVTGYVNQRKVMINSTERKKHIPKWESWPLKHKIYIGTALLDAFVKATSDYTPDGERIHGTAFVEVYVQRQFKQMTHLVAATQKAHTWIKANTDICQEMYPDYMPCIEPPKDWTSPTDGGFHSKELRRRKPLVKMQRREYLKAMADRKGKMNRFYETANVLQRTPWEVNTFVYNQMYNEYKRMDGIEMPSPEPLTMPDCPLPPWDQGTMTNEEFKLYKQVTKAQLTYSERLAFAEWANTCKQVKFAEIERASKSMQISRTLRVANKFRKYDEFYFVWTADFRGRFYTVGTALTCQGTEKSKALCKFKKGVPLGITGLKHLMYHAAGTYGIDKCTLEERIQFVYKNKEAIIQTGLNPDEAREFWRKADHPYMFLAVCEELAECLILGGDCVDFISHIPCAQDGSCNGIQHYSAMLLDERGATSTNLQDSDLPGDIYTDVGDKVRAYLKKSIDDHVHWHGYDWITASPQDRAIAEGWLEFGIERSCTKKPTMVIPYGGTKIGCRDQMALYLREETEKRKSNDPMYEHSFHGIECFNDLGDPTAPDKYAITYLHHLVWKALDDVVVAARKAMKFLTDITKVIVHKTNAGSISWRTLSGFIVYQDIRDTSTSRITIQLGGSINLSFRSELPTIDKRRMQTSIAPNFVHSIDSSHLQLVVTLANDLGINDMCVIHDSFGAHAGNCDLLHTAIRHSFVELHSKNLLETFYWDQVKQHPELINDFPPISDIKRGNFDLNRVFNSTHFFR